MNTNSMPVTAVNPGDPSTHGTGARPAMTTFAWLLKREYWEHRGGFLRAPAVTALIFLTLTLMGLITLELTARRFNFNISNLHLDQLLENIVNHNVVQVNTGIDIALLSLGSPIGVVLFFVLFFYLLGALYDDRRDRSVLFWKSLPLSDTQTVLSKVVSAALVAPALAVAAMIALHLGFLILLSLYALLHGINPFPLLWSPLHLLGLWLKLVVLIPLNAIWALPTIGWLLLCSSFARSKPFLWAVAVPVIAGIIVGWIDLMSQLSLPNVWFWQHIVGRALLSVIPGSWMSLDALKALGHAHGNQGDILAAMLSVDSLRNLLFSLNLWLGAAAGCAMIAAAIWFRRRRTEAYA